MSQKTFLGHDLRSFVGWGTGEDCVADTILRVHYQALGIFCLSRLLTKRSGLISCLMGIACLMCEATAGFPNHDTRGEHTVVKRRQQGILTGMPFMANIASRTFVDDLGRKLYLAKAPTRLVSLAPSVTEILFALGVGDRLVAVTPFCDYPPEAARIDKIDGARPSVESLIALRADLILTPRAFIQPTLIEKVEQLKIPLFVMDAHTVEDVLSHVHTVGRMVERSDAATRLVAGMRGRLQHVKERTASLARPRLLYVLNSRPLMTVGPGSFIHQLIELAGAENILSAMGQGYPRISMEDVLRYDPEVLLFPVGATEGIPAQEQQQWRQWSSMSAVRTNRLYQLESVLLDRPGPRIVEGLERLAALLHPSVFSAVPPSMPPSAP